MVVVTGAVTPEPPNPRPYTRTADDIGHYIRVWWDHSPIASLHSPGRVVKIDIVEGPWALNRHLTDQLIARLIRARCETWPDKSNGIS